MVLRSAPPLHYFTARFILAMSVTFRARMNSITLTALMEANRGAARSVVYLEAKATRDPSPLRRFTSARSASCITCRNSVRGPATD